MEYAALSRRVYWACFATVEVAPGWALGMPPPYLTHFIAPHHVRRYLLATRSTEIRADSEFWTHIQIPHLHADGSIDTYYFSWIELFNRSLITWDNFRCHDVALLTWPHPNISNTEQVRIYLKRYYRLVYDLCTQLRESS